MDVRREGDGFVFDGHGFGHGVGYSQWGGAVMGKATDYRDILRFYYPGAELDVLWR
jgi:stage II sporulation protein D